jgi:tetratricopeptide (TPR) repeat protein
MQNDLLEARRCLDAGNLPQAELFYRKVLDREPQNVPALHELGIVALQTGRPEVAADYLRQAVTLDDRNANAYNHLGVALAGAQKMDEAVECLTRAVAIDSKSPDTHYNLAKVFASAKRLDEAVASYQTALQINPNNPEAQFNLGNTLRDLGRLDDAAAGYRAAIRLRPNYVKAMNNLGNVLRDQGKLYEAEVQHREAVRIKPDYAEGFHNLGVSLAAQRKFDEAVNCFQTALRIKPGFLQSRNSLAKALTEQGKLDEAVALMQSATTAEKESVDAYLKLSEKLRIEGRIDEAIAYAQKAIDANSQLAVAHHNMGLALLAKNQPEKAIESYRKALVIRPDFAEVHNNLAVALHTQGRFDEALERIDRTLRIKPQLTIAHLNRAISWLRIGDFQRGLPEFEWRRMMEQRNKRKFDAPLWDGSSLPEGTILLHDEQGLGDTMQAVRYAPLVKQRCGRVIVQCQKVLAPLLSRCPGIDQLIAKGEKLPSHDAQIPLMSLPLAFDTTVATIPNRVPYIFPDESLAEKWRQRLAAYPGFRVGIAWQGNKKYAGDPYRSIPLRHFEPLARIPNVRLFSLQKGDGVEQMAQMPADFSLVDFGAELDAAAPFADTAAVMQNLDLIITSDTAIPHLAGSMGRPVWVALNFASDWRWLDGREDSPWYPTMRLFRQPRLADWDALFAHIATELQAAVDGDETKLIPLRQDVQGPFQVPVSAGELLDKIAILEIKSERIADENKLSHVRRELQELQGAFGQSVSAPAELQALRSELKAINERLWDVENDIRHCESQADFGPRFVDLARSVYFNNDRRVAIKRKIDQLLGSALIEQKEYVSRGPA